MEDYHIHIFNTILQTLLLPHSYVGYWPFRENRGDWRWYMRSGRLGGTKHNVFPQNDVKDNRRFIMMSFRRHICPPKTPVPQLSRNG